MKTMIPLTLSMVLPGSVTQVFDFIAAEDVLPKILTGYGPLAAVVRTSDHTGPWTVAGSQRRVHLADHSSASEQVTLYERPHRFNYRVWDFSHPLIRSLAASGRGEWTFREVGEGTQVVWTYTFVARHWAARWPIWLVVHLLWRGYMRVCLLNSRAQLAELARRNAHQP
jgi:hypothetical protein